jgi:Uma2 family endonuclease
MTAQNVIAEIYYPESDGEPMAETDLHRDWMIRILDVLQHRYRGQQVYISGNLLMYYVEGDPAKSVAPDAFVVKGVDSGRRRVYKIWVEGKAPDVVFETTSNKTQVNDTQKKFQLYAQLGIPEYFLYDPTADYLEPPLQGYRLGEAGYERLEPDTLGRLPSEELDMFVELQDGELVFRDRSTEQVQSTKAESLGRAVVTAEAERAVEATHRRLAQKQRQVAEEQRRLAEAERDQERHARLAAEKNARLLAEELARLRGQSTGTSPDSENGGAA